MAFSVFLSHCLRQSLVFPIPQGDRGVGSPGGIGDIANAIAVRGEDMQEANVKILERLIFLDVFFNYK